MHMPTYKVISFRGRPVSSCSSPTSAIDMPDPKNVRVAAEILYLTSTEAKIHYLCLELFEILSFRFCGRHFGLLEGDGLIPIMLYCSPVIFRKSHQSTPLNSKRLQNDIENTGLRGKLHPHGPY